MANAALDVREVFKTLVTPGTLVEVVFKPGTIIGYRPGEHDSSITVASNTPFSEDRQLTTLPSESTKTAEAKYVRLIDQGRNPADNAIIELRDYRHLYEIEVGTINSVSVYEKTREYKF